ncbi:hypothetical protein UFOVP16_10 [uncultured Caudovirales phage]|uniref:Uncharacterized protein n=1 Tax=uncultured Caudovirales phage TaxID=2100421 RepID=A0A6J5KI90_9CAUD|nr:hypothetical protein UFOVP16_10 [uncultured Caudovirales phage]
MPAPHRYVYEYMGDDRPQKRIPVVRCTCGCEVYCDNYWTNPCDRCGTEYNATGQKLNPRNLWNLQ